MEGAGVYRTQGTSRAVRLCRPGLIFLPETVGQKDTAALEKPSGSVPLIERVTVFVRLGDLPHHPAGDADCDHVRRNGSGNHASSSDDGIVADGHTGQNGRSGSDPDVVADGDRLGDLQPGLALFRIDRMLGGCETAVGSDEHMASERHLGAVGDDQVVVGVKVISDGDVVSVIAPERRSEYHVFPHLSQQFGQDAALRFPIVGIQLVILVAFILAFADFRLKAGL